MPLFVLLHVMVERPRPRAGPRSHAEPRRSRSWSIRIWTISRATRDNRRSDLSRSTFPALPLAAQNADRNLSRRRAIPVRPDLLIARHVKRLPRTFSAGVTSGRMAPRSLPISRDNVSAPKKGRLPGPTSECAVNCPECWYHVDGSSNVAPPLGSCSQPGKARQPLSE